MLKRSFLSLCLFSLAVVFAQAVQANPITLNDGEHTLTLPEAPKRVVALEFSFVDALASIHVSPVGVADDGDASRVLPRAREAIGEWTSVGLRSQPNIEVIARLKPDLIIADESRHAGLYDELSSIAPTLLLPSRGESYESSLTSAELIGKALDRSVDMQDRISANRQHLKDIAANIPANTQVLFGVAREDSFSVHGPDSYAGSVLKTIGLTVPSVRAGAAPTEFVSLEQLLALNPGWLLVGHYRHPSLVDAWSKQPLWQALGAVQAGHVADVDGNVWARNRGIMASEQIAEDALKILTGKDQE
jgi:ABC-type Fe3+-citrate transport system substrate-binding protein